MLGRRINLHQRRRSIYLPFKDSLFSGMPFKVNIMAMVFHWYSTSSVGFFQHEGLASAVSRSQGDDHRGTVSNDGWIATVTSSLRRTAPKGSTSCAVRWRQRGAMMCHANDANVCKLKGLFGCKTRKSWRELAKGGSVDWCLFQDMDSLKNIFKEVQSPC